MDPLERGNRTIRIPIRIVDGRPEYLYAGTLPRLRNGSIGTLLVPGDAIVESAVLNVLEHREDRTILPPDSTLLIGISPRGGGEETIARERLAHPVEGGAATYFVEVEAVDPVVLRMRGTQAPTLRPGRFRIPIMSTETRTLNQAYTLTSLRFEGWRSSATGNVFQKAFYLTGPGPGRRWRRLDVLRLNAAADLEERLFQPQLALSLG